MLSIFNAKYLFTVIQNQIFRNILYFKVQHLTNTIQFENCPKILYLRCRATYIIYAYFGDCYNSTTAMIYILPNSIDIA